MTNFDSLQSTVVYMDQHIWGGMADDYPQYTDLKKQILKVLPSEKLLVPYSIVHIHELSELGKGTMTKQERFQKVAKKLEFMKELSNSVILEANDSYTNFKFNFRDPFEAYSTITEIEFESASAASFLELVPKELVREIQSLFNVGASRLNNYTEEDAIKEIDKGFSQFIKKCKTNPAFHRNVIDNQKKQSIEMVIAGHKSSLLAIDEAQNFISEQFKCSDLLNAKERALAERELKKLLDQKPEIENRLLELIKAVEVACEKSFLDGPMQISFETFLDQVMKLNQNPSLPREFHKAQLLDFFGYKAKLSNRRSDYYDSLHRRYANTCSYFVTDDPRLQEKLGELNESIEGSECILLDAKGFLKKIDESLSK